MSDAVNNGPRVAAANTARIDAQIKLADARAKKAHDKASGLRRRARGDGPLAKSRKLRAGALDATADRHRAKANQLRADLAKAKADEAARNAKHVKRTVASTARAGLVPKVVGQGGSPGRAKAGQVAKPVGQVRASSGDPWRDPAASGETVCEAIARYAPKSSREPARPHTQVGQAKGGGQPVASKPKEIPVHPKVTPGTHGPMCPCCGWHHGPDYQPKRGKHCGWCLGHEKGGGPNYIPAPGKSTHAQPKGTPVMTVSGEAVNIEQTRAMLAQIKTQVGDLRGSMESAAGSLASGGLNNLAGAFTSADDSLESVLTELGNADKRLSEQEAIAEAAQVAGEMHGDKSFYGA